MSKTKNVEYQLVEIDHSLANCQTQLSLLQVEIFKLELKKEKLEDKLILQSLKTKISTKRKGMELMRVTSGAI